MTLLTLGEVQQGLDAAWQHLEPVHRGFRLIPGGVSAVARAECERTLGVRFSGAFREAIESYDFGWLTIGPVAFCATGDYLRMLVRRNEGLPWWDEGQRPPDLISIAGSDPYDILLDVAQGSVRAFDGELGWRTSTLVARDFTTYLRGLGTAWLLARDAEDRRAFAGDLATEVGAEDHLYWRRLMRVR